MKQVRLVQIDDLSLEESKNEIYLETQYNTQLHIVQGYQETTISLPSGNEVNIVNGVIIIKDKLKQ